jgi:hypothetical protein
MQRELSDRHVKALTACMHVSDETKLMRQLGGTYYIFHASCTEWCREIHKFGKSHGLYRSCLHLLFKNEIAHTS